MSFIICQDEFIDYLRQSHRKSVFPSLHTQELPPIEVVIFVLRLCGEVCTGNLRFGRDRSNVKISSCVVRRRGSDAGARMLSVVEADQRSGV